MSEANINLNAGITSNLSLFMMATNEESFQPEKLKRN